MESTKGYNERTGMLFTKLGQLVAVVNKPQKIRLTIFKECKEAFDRFSQGQGHEVQLDSVLGKLRNLAQSIVDQDIPKAIGQAIDMGLDFQNNVDLYGSVLFNSGYDVGFSENLDNFVSYCSEGGDVCSTFLSPKVCISMAMHSGFAMLCILALLCYAFWLCYAFNHYSHALLCITAMHGPPASCMSWAQLMAAECSSLFDGCSCRRTSRRGSRAVASCSASCPHHSAL
jgi:hypothetical protein